MIKIYPGWNINLEVRKNNCHSYCCEEYINNKYNINITG
jgi:hypothetical protein